MGFFRKKGNNEPEQTQPVSMEDSPIEETDVSPESVDFDDEYESDEEVGSDSYDDESLEENEGEEFEESPKRRGLYPREYFDPSDIYLNKKTNEEEYYFNLPKTLKLHHMGLLWKILPEGAKDALETWVWDKDFLHDIAVKQHEKSEYLNSLTASEQLRYDIKVLFTRLLLMSILVIGIFCYSVFIVKPNNMFNEAMDLANAKHYQEAMTIFEELGTKKNANLYVGYCMGQQAMVEGRYDDAKGIFEQLTPYANVIGINNIEDYIKEAMYQKAISYYNDGEWSKAIDVLVPIIKYSNAVQYYEKCQYKLADIKYEELDYYGALDKFSKIASYEDVEQRMNNILSNIYVQGLDLYNEKDYMGAAAIFNSIVQYKYKDTDQMSTQCFYKSAQDLFDNGEYLKACELFEQIPHYKDSQTMVKECKYRMLNSDEYDSNVLNLLALQGYRDVSSTLVSNPYNIYGEWVITEINSKAASNEVFMFDPDGNFVCNETRLPDVAVSANGLKYQYIWDGEKFETADSKYQIYIDDYQTVKYTSGVNKYIVLKCVNEGNESVYKCQKLNDLDVYYEASIVVNAVDTSDYELIQMYLDKLAEQEKNEPLPEETVTDPEEDQTVEIPGFEEALYKSFDGAVIRVYDDAFLVEPDNTSEEYALSDRFVVIYDYSTDLTEGDMVTVVYQDEINTEIEPYEITAHRIQYLSGAETEAPAEETTGDEESSDGDETSDDDSSEETTDEDSSGFSF